MTKFQDRRDGRFLAVANTLARWSNSPIRGEGDERFSIGADTAAAAEAQAPASRDGCSTLNDESSGALEHSAPQQHSERISAPLVMYGRQDHISAGEIVPREGRLFRGISAPVEGPFL
jgi:hypothetical protein